MGQRCWGGGGISVFGWWKAAEHVGLKAPIALISAAAGFGNYMVRITPKSNDTNGSLYLMVAFVL